MGKKKKKKEDEKKIDYNRFNIDKVIAKAIEKKNKLEEKDAKKGKKSEGKKEKKFETVVEENNGDIMSAILSEKGSNSKKVKDPEAESEETVRKALKQMRKDNKRAEKEAGKITISFGG